MTVYTTPPAERPNQKVGSAKRTRFQRERDLADIARLYLKGSTHAQIADWLSEHRPYSISTCQVGYDLKLINTRWQEEYLKDIDRIKARELARIDELEQAYWQGWERSQQKKHVEELTRIDEMLPSGKQANAPQQLVGSRLKAHKRDEERDGDSVFLEGIRWCIEQRAKILGFNAPQRLAIDWRSEAAKAGVDPSEVFDEMVGQFLKSADVAGGHGGGGVEGSPEET